MTAARTQTGDKDYYYFFFLPKALGKDSKKGKNLDILETQVGACVKFSKQNKTTQEVQVKFLVCLILYLKHAWGLVFYLAILPVVNDP